MVKKLVRNRLKKRLSVMIIWMALFSAPGLCSWSTQQEPEHDPLKYEMSVKAMHVPFVAVDSRGNPVFDLREDEIEIYVNFKAVEIIYLSRMSFGEAEVQRQKKDQPQTAVSANKKEVKKVPAKKSIRYKFIIIDAMLNRYNGLKHSKMLARKLIETGEPEDRFVLLEIRFGGLKYIAGPEPASPRLISLLDKVKKNPQKLNWWLRPEHRHRDGFDLERYLMEYGMKNAQKDTVKMYVDAFEQFKNALQTIDAPKVTYLLSEGIRGQLHAYGLYHGEEGQVKEVAQFSKVNYSREIDNYIVKEVHDGGSILQRIYAPGLRPSSIGPLSTWLNRSTSAYYEAFFRPAHDAGEDLNIVVKCKRKGVHINAVGHKEKDKPYRKLSHTRKKLFAICAAAGRSWSNLLGRVKRIPCEKLQVEKIGDETRVKVNVPLPESLKNRKLDIFALRFDDKYQDADVVLENRLVEDSVTLTIPTGKSKKHLYFVIVEPDTAFCIYNKVL